jgi:hypothetical protein
MLKSCTLILVLISGDKLKLCKPCNMCNHIIDKYKIKNVVVFYTEY